MHPNMPLSNQDVFQVASAVKELVLSPSHPQGEDMVTEKSSSEREVRRAVLVCVRARVHVCVRVNVVDA